MAALDGKHEITRGCRITAQHMHLRAKLAADHSARILNLARLAERKAGRQRMQHGPAFLAAARGACFKHPVNIRLCNLAAGDMDLRLIKMRSKPAPRRINDHAFNLNSRHTLGGINCEPDRCFRRFEIDNRAGLNAARALMADADNAAPVRAPAQSIRLIARAEARDEADDFRSSNVEDRKHRAFARRQRRQAQRKRFCPHGRRPFALAALAALAAAAARPAAASSVNRATRRPGWRKSNKRTSLASKW